MLKQLVMVVIARKIIHSDVFGESGEIKPRRLKSPIALGSL